MMGTQANYETTDLTVHDTVTGLMWQRAADTDGDGFVTSRWVPGLVE